MAKYSLGGYTYEKPDNISSNCMKRIIAMCGGFISQVQPTIDLVSKEIEIAIKRKKETATVVFENDGPSRSKNIQL